MRMWGWIVFVVLVIFLSGAVILQRNYDRIAAFVLAPQSTAAAAMANADFALVTPNGRHFEISQMASVIDGFPQEERYKRRLVLFVHGLGPEPDGEFGLAMLQTLAEEHQADVIMFTWPSWNSATELPTLNARLAAQPLAGLLADIARLSRQGGPLADREIVIVAHSMAAEIFRSLGSGSPHLEAGSIERILFAVPETALRKHGNWMRNLTFADEIYVLVNEADPALQITTTLYNEARLGRSLSHLDGTPEPLAENATYIRLDPQSWQHFFFISKYRNAAIDSVFRDILANGAGGLENPYLSPGAADNVFSVVNGNGAGN